MLAVNYRLRNLALDKAKIINLTRLSSQPKRAAGFVFSQCEFSSFPFAINNNICWTSQTDNEIRSFHSSSAKSLLSAGLYIDYKDDGFRSQDWLKEENKFTKQIIESRLSVQASDPTIESLQEEIISASLVTNNDDNNAITKELGPSGRFAYWSTDDSRTGSRTFWRQSYKYDEAEQEEIVLQIDFQTHALIGNMSLSAKEEWVVFITCPLSSNMTNLLLRHISTGQQRNVAFPNNDFRLDNVEFGPVDNDELRLYLTTINSLGRPHAVFSLDISINQPNVTNIYEDITIGKPVLMFKEDCEEYFVNIQRSKGCQHLIISSSGKTSNQIHLIDSSSSMQLVKQRQEGIQYYVDCDHDGNVFLLAHRFPDQSNASSLGIEMSLFRTHIDQLPLTDNFGSTIYCNAHSKEEEQFFIEEMDLFHSHIVLYQRSNVNGRQQIMVGSLHDFMASHKIIPLPEDCKWASVTPGGNMYYYSNICSFHLETPISPSIQIHYHMENNLFLQNYPDPKFPWNDSIVKKREDCEGIKMTRMLVPSHDKVNVPMTLLKPKKSNGSVVLIGYGSYGENIPMQYDPTLVPYFKRGVAIAYAHTRGGGELGKSWYQAGRLDKKDNAVQDYIACAHELKKTFPQLFGKGFSAGGILVGKAAFVRPTDSQNGGFLFQGVCLTNAFLDVMKSMTMTNHFLTQHEWEEFGNPSQDDLVAQCIAKYSPCQNIPCSLNELSCPHFLVIGTLDDHHVPVWNSTSFSFQVHNSMMKQNKPEGSEDDNKDYKKRMLLHIVKSGGHHLHGTRLEVASLEAAFVLGIISANK